MSSRAWALLRAVALAMCVVLLSPISPAVLVALPVAVLLLAFRPYDVRALLFAGLLIVLAFGDVRGSHEALWYAERGWALMAAGGFILVAALVERKSLLLRGLGGLAAGAAGLGLVAWLDPALLGELDWRMTQRFHEAALTAQELVSTVEGSERLGASLRAALYQWAGTQEIIYPALLALATVGALAVGWYVVARFAGVVTALPPLRNFRFDDGLVWVLLLSLALVALPVGGQLLERVGGNAALFLGVLYLLRGAGVLMWFAAATLGTGWMAWLWGLVALLLYPVAAGVALILGVGDSWFDLRGWVRRARERGTEA